MKFILFLLLSLGISLNVFSQNAGNVADSAIRSFQWDTEKVAQGTMMFLDVPFKRAGQDSADYLTLTVAKDRTHKRPAFISIIIPNNVEQANGIFLKFSRTNKDENGKWNIVMDRSDPIRVPFEKCDNEKKICTARISGGYVTDPQTDEKLDIFQRFMDFDHVYFLFVYSDGTHQSVAVPLFSFKEQYKAIAAEDTPAFHQ